MISEQAIKRNQNRSAILNAIQANGPLKRMAFSALCGIRKSSITSIVDELIENDILCNVDPNKPRSPLIFTTDKYFIAAAAVSVNRVDFALVDLRGEMHEQFSISYDVNEIGSNDFLELIAHGIQLLINKRPKSILSIGLSTPGIVDSDVGVCRYVINVPQLQDVKIKKFLKSKFDYDVFIENDVRASLWSTVWFDKSYVKTGDILYLEVGDGISTALLVNGVRHRGANSSAGEVGHLTAGTEKRVCRCGKFDCLETYSSLSAIITEINNLLPGCNIKTAKQIGENSGKQIVVNVLDRAMAKLADVVAPLVAYIDPQQILLGNQSQSFYEALLPVFEKHIRANLQGCASQKVDIRIAPSSEDCALRGIAGVAICEAFKDILKLINKNKKIN